MRADWTGTGAYGGLPGLAVDALVTYENGLDGALAVLRNLSLAAKTSMPAQGIAVTTPPFIIDFLNKNNGMEVPSDAYAPAFPEFFDEKAFGAGSFWPHSLRSIQNAIAAINDAIIRSVFGWRPDWSTWTNTSDSKAAIDAALFLPRAPRNNFTGTLYGLRTPVGTIDVTAGGAGLSWTFSASSEVASSYLV